MDNLAIARVLAEIGDLHARRAREAGGKIVISSDAHSAGAFGGTGMRR